MLKKSYSAKGNKCKVTFQLPKDIEADDARLVGDFNDWDRDAAPMKKMKDGAFSASLSLPAGERYRFRYLLDGDRWENDSEADGYEPNNFGTENSVLKL